MNFCRQAATFIRFLTAIAFSVLAGGIPFRSGAQQAAAVAMVETSLPDAPGRESSPTPSSSDAQPSGSIGGTITDRSGALVAAAKVTLRSEDKSLPQEAITDATGHFSFDSVPAGPFRLSVTSSGFAPQETSGVLHPGEVLNLPEIALAVGSTTTSVEVVVPGTEIAQEQISAQEKQRLLGVIPNFYVSYIHDAAPLTSRQKFQLAWKTTLDPVTFGVNAVIAGVQQANNDFAGYGQGFEGYAKRYGASYANFLTGTMIGKAILPSLLKQDPRYFYKGVGSIKSRIGYAMANAVICRGDNGHWQPAYSSILGSLASSGISNLYYPAADRNGGWLTVENTLIDIGADALGNIVQEFLFKKLTPHLPKNEQTTP